MICAEITVITTVPRSDNTPVAVWGLITYTDDEGDPLDNAHPPCLYPEATYSHLHVQPVSSRHGQP